MPPKKEICRYYQRGSCQYGDRCKFLHPTQQQSKPNPSGFGIQTGNPFQRTNQQQQMPNPFGFGVQNNNQPTGGNNFVPNQPQVKPFENKWSRFPPINNGGASVSRQPETQPSAANHECTDSESCKRVIAEDLQIEKPLWKLTCYGHQRNGPCDVVGDISCEEMRALAYDDAKLGKSLQFIIDRERSLVNSKLVEFQNLLLKPHTVSSNVALTTQNPFIGAQPNALTVGVSTTVTSFTQLGPTINSGSTVAPSYTFGQSSVNAFGRTAQANASPFNTSGAFGKQIYQQPVQNPFSFGPASSSSSSLTTAKNPFLTSADNQSQFVSSGFSSASTAIEPSNLIANLPEEDNNVDDSIWRKSEWKWNSGEIPERPPPEIHIR